MRRRTQAAVLGSALAALAIAPGFASASFAGGSGTSLSYQAVAGETNNLTIERSGANYIVSDPGAAITPTAPCAAVTASQVTCPAAGVTQFSVSLGDLNDHATIGASVTGLNFISVAGETGNDTITNSSAETFSAAAGPGNDTVNGGSGFDLMSDDAGDDTYIGGDGSDSFGMGSDPLGADVIDGGPGFDNVAYNSRTHPLFITLDGNANDGEGCPGPTCENDNVMPGADSVFSGSAADVMVGSAGPEILVGADGADTVDTGGGDDTAAGGNDADILQGGDGDDEMEGGDGADLSDAGAGNDVFDAEYADSGADTLIGGSGLDTVGSPESVAVSVSLNGVADDVVSAPGSTSPPDNVGADIENLVGGERDDTLTGNAAANEITGLEGNDVIVGAGGSDGLSGGDGDDSLDGGTDPDTLDGASGVDQLRSRDGGPDQLDCGSSADTVIGDSFDLVPASCEIVTQGIVIASKARAGAKDIELKLTCPAAEPAACKAKVSMTAKGKKIAKGKATIPVGDTKSVALKLTSKGFDAIDAPGKLNALAKATFTDASGIKVTTEQKVTVG